MKKIRHSSNLAAIVLTGIIATVAKAEVTTFWESSPVLPNQTVLVQGGGFSTDMDAYVGKLKDSKPGKPGGSLPNALKWEKVQVLQAEDYSFKFTIPEDFKQGVYAYKIGDQKSIDAKRLINLPEVWWFQGDQNKAASAGGTIRVFGISLDIDNKAQVALVKDGKTTQLPISSANQWALTASLPKDLASGAYELFVHNGSGGKGCWVSGGELDIVASKQWPDKLFNVVDFGADASVMESMNYNGDLMPPKKDSTEAVKKALQAAKENGGGVVYFPAGQYLVTGMLDVPKFTVIKGDGANSSAIEWPMNPNDTLNALIRGTSHFKVQDIALFAQNHFAGIMANDGHSKDSGHVHIERVDMQLNRFLSLTGPRHFKDHKKRSQAEWEHYSRIGAIHIGGDNIKITDCNILSSKETIVVDQASGVIRGNFCRYPTTVSSYQGWQVFIRGGGPLILEDNELIGGGIGVTTHNTIYYNQGKQTRTTKNLQIRHCYIANNKVSDCYRGDAEGLTYDQHGPFVIYGGTIKAASDLDVQLKKKISSSWVNCQISVLDGKGRGQRRFIVKTQGDKVIVDRDWDVPLDETSYVVIYKGYFQHLIIDNDFTDVGCAQLWGAGNDFILSGNTLNRAGSMHSTSFSYAGGVTPAIRCQFLNNKIIAGLGTGASYRHLRATIIGANTYPPVKGYTGPMSIAQIMRGNVIENHGSLFIRGRVSDGIIEGNTIKNSDYGILVDQEGGRWTPKAGGDNDYTNVLKDAPLMPEGIVMRDNTFENVKTPYTGDRLDNNHLQK